jgi:hypothetical protein
MAETLTPTVPKVDNNDIIGSGCCPFFSCRRGRKAADTSRKERISSDSKSKELSGNGLIGDKSRETANVTAEQSDLQNVATPVPAPTFVHVERPVTVPASVATPVAVSANVAPENAPEITHSRVVDAILPSAKESGFTEKASRREEAVHRLNVAVTNLQTAMGVAPAKLEEINLQDIRGVNDIGCMARKVGSTIANYMEKSESLKASRSPVRVFVETWFKRSIPFVQGGLNVAKVCTFSF